MTAEIVFAVGQNPQKFQFHHTTSGNAWRYLADEAAVVFAPLCDTLARPVSVPPLFDRLEIWPCRWGCPDFSQTNPSEYADLKIRFLAGEYPPNDIPIPPPDQLERYWPSFLVQNGNQILWEQCANDAIKRHWINNLEELTDPGFRLFMLAQQSPHQLRGSEPTVLVKDLDRIRFQANFHNGEKCQAIYLADCKTDLLTSDEQRLSPQFIAREQEQFRKQMELEAAKEKNIAQGLAVAEQLKSAAQQVSKATEASDLYSNVSLAGAKDAAVKRNVPKEFVAYCLQEWHVRKFPTTDQVFKAVQMLPLFRALRDPRTPSRSTVYRWLTIVRKELEKRGLIQPRVKGPTAKKAIHSDVDNLPAPIQEETEQEQAQEEHELPDIRTQELGGPQD
jgi:hypothetical protein